MISPKEARADSDVDDRRLLRIAESKLDTVLCKRYKANSPAVVLRTEIHITYRLFETLLERYRSAGWRIDRETHGRDIAYVFRA